MKALREAQASCLHLGLSLAIIAILVSGCTVRLISTYDPETDKAVTTLQRKLETFFVKLENTAGTEAADYKHHTGFYEEVKVDISAIEVRAKARPKNDKTIEQIQLLRDSLNKLEQLHKGGIRDPEVVAVIRTQFNTSITAILKLEMAKRRNQ